MTKQTKPFTQQSDIHSITEQADGRYDVSLSFENGSEYSRKTYNALSTALRKAREWISSGDWSACND